MAPSLISVGPTRLTSLTSLRFAFAFPVLFCHMAYVSAIFAGNVNDVLRSVVPAATISVSGFFVLSGFVLTWSHRSGDRVLAFWRRRFWKIYPNHLLAWVAAILLVFTPRDPPFGGGAMSEQGADTAIAGALLMQNWLPRPNWIGAFNTPAWSICCEAFFYALFPLLIIAARRLPGRSLWPIWSATALTVLLLPWGSTAINGPPVAGSSINLNSYWFIYVLPVTRLPEFWLGILTARLVRDGRWPRPEWWNTYVPLIVCLSLLHLLPPQYDLGSAAAPALALIIAHRALADIHGRTRWMAHPALLALGSASYALYITHFPLLMTARLLLGADRHLTLWTGIPLVLALMALAVLLSLAVHRFYEQPLMRRWGRSRPAEPSSPARQPDLSVERPASEGRT